MTRRFALRILVSGASAAGPVLAYWLTGHGSSVTVVERAPAPHRTGGQAVDLFRPAMNISDTLRLVSGPGHRGLQTPAPDGPSARSPARPPS
jgi:2-polyprenyl-6-methoxyphenol hydroxylase-like FAD-dependent oxidoreductase